MLVLSELLDILELTPIGENRFEGKNYQTEWKRVFGGQVLGQSLYAAYQSVPNDRIAHSMHGYFILGGRIDIPIEYHVERVRDGKSFTTRRVIAYQEGKAIFIMAASFQREEEGVEHQSSIPNVLTPNLLLTDLQQAEKLKQMDPDRYERLIRSHPQVFEFRPVDKAIYLNTHSSPAMSHTWFKTKEKVELPLPVQHQLLAFASDYSLLLTATLPHRQEMIRSKVFYASIDHAIWFHRPFKIDDWLLYAIDSPSASNSRGFSRGNIFTKDGDLVASTTQEGLMRKYAP
ncbi:MAG: acyl-CoA thioesterase [Flavobacteriaceae bacterium]